MALLRKCIIFSCKTIKVRTFLSSAYKCQEVWDQRKRNPMFHKIDYDDLFHQLDRSFQIGSRISILDVDLFINGISGASYQNELEDVLFKLRLNPETGLMSSRTMHAVIRYYLDINKKNDLLTLLSNRLGYGIFPDYYASNILMNEFLKENDVISAAKVAVLQMLQEDFNHVILQKFSLVSCYKYLNSPLIWSPPDETKVEEDDEDEIERVRVSFIRNPYFDDHFDLINTNHLVGKTMYMAGTSSDKILELSSQVVGLALYEKHPNLLELLQKIESSGKKIHMDAVIKAEDYIKSIPKQKDDSQPIQESEDTTKLKSQILKRLDALKKSAETIANDIELLATEELKRTIATQEPKDIQDLTKLYRQWEDERESHIQYEINEDKRRKALAEIERTKDELRKQEEVIFFFDKEDEWKLKVTEKEEEMRLLAEEQSKIKKKDKEEEYIPPDVVRKRE